MKSLYTQLPPGVNNKNNNTIIYLTDNRIQLQFTGSKYAMLSMKVLVSTFLRNFSVHTDIKLSDIKLKLDLLMRSAHGYPVSIQSRNRRPTYKQN